MEEKFDHLACPICGGELLYSEGTHDLGCRNKARPNQNSGKKKNNFLHEETAPYGNISACDQLIKEEVSSVSKMHEHESKNCKLCETRKSNPTSKYQNLCELNDYIHSPQYECEDEDRQRICVFGISFTESANVGTLWSIRIVDGETDYAALMKLMQSIEQRVRAKEPLAANVPNLPRKIERSTVSKLAFSYKLEIEDLYSIKYSTETIERLAMFYNLTQKEIRHIKQSDILEE